MFGILKLVFSPLVSLFILVLGSGLFTTLLVVRLHLDHASTMTIGVMTGAYYIGLILGSFRIEKFIIRVGHIRAFSAFASALAVVSLLQGILFSTWIWILLRLIGGFATAGLFIVIESWLLILGTIKTRGQILAFYMITFYAAQACGQFLINLGDPKTLLLFSISAMLSSLSVIPLAMTKVGQPQISAPSALSFKQLYKTSGSGVIGCFSGGLIMGAIYGLLPLFIIEQTKSNSLISLFMALTIFGGMALQYPFGKLSDHVERRIVLIMITILMMIASFAMVYAFDYSYVAYMAVFLFGGMTFTIYPVSISHACDNLEPNDMISGTQGLLLAYSIGAAIGPILGAVFMRYLGTDGLFAYFILVGIILTCFFGWRRYQIPSSKPEEPFVSLPQTTPITAELDPRTEES